MGCVFSQKDKVDSAPDNSPKITKEASPITDSTRKDLQESVARPIQDQETLLKEAASPTAIHTPPVIEVTEPIIVGQAEIKEMMDVEMTGGPDFPSWEVQPLSLMREGKIGRGGAGNVIRARDPSTGRVVALKLVPLNMKEEHSGGFLEKLRELYDSKHHNVAAFHGAAYDVQRSEMVIAFEYMDQRSLKDVIIRTPSRQIPEEIMGCCAGQVISGLQYLHEKRRIIHRDIKPSNVLLNSRGQFKLADFGMSKELHTLDAGHTWVGTSSYMSPERVGGETYGFNADIWSLGVLVLELCTGHSPYEGTTQYDILDRIVDGEPPALPPTFSNQAIDFVHLCTKKLPAERPHANFFVDHPFVVRNAAAPVTAWLATLMPDSLPSTVASPSSRNGPPSENSGRDAGRRCWGLEVDDPLSSPRLEDTTPQDAIVHMEIHLIKECMAVVIRGNGTLG